MVTDNQKLMTPCVDPEHLHSWIIKYCDLDFPNQTISRFSNSNPLDFIWQVYESIIQGRSFAVLALAGRDSCKTLALSVIDLLSILHDERHAIHIGMTRAQATRARNYLERYTAKEPLKGSVVKQNVTEIQLNVDGKKVGLELLSATPKAVQGSHTAMLSFDELASSMEPNNVKAYRDAHGILGSSEKGKPAVIVKITSRQSGYTLAEEELRDATKSGLKVLKWTTLDATERCPDWRSGTEKLPLYLNPLYEDRYTEKEFKQLPDSKRDGFILSNDTLINCKECPLVPFCQGDLKKQKSKSLLLRTIDDVIQKIRLSGSWDWAVAQIMSLRPSSEGLVYFEFDRTLHVPGWDKMWETLTGQERAGVTRELFVDELKKRGCTFYAGMDWGWSSPSTCVVLAIDSREMIYVIDAIGRRLTPDPEFIEMLRQTVHKKYDIQMYCPDLANGSGNALLRQAGLPTTGDIDKTVNLGINIVKGFLRVPGTNGMVRLFIAPDLISQDPKHAGIIEEFELYHKKIDASGKILDDHEPEKEFDHYLDALRYVIYWLFGRKRMRVGTDYEKPKTVSPNSNVPTHEQILKDFSIPYIDNRDKKDEGGGPDDDLPPGSGAIWGWS